MDDETLFMVSLLTVGRPDGWPHEKFVGKYD